MKPIFALEKKTGIYNFFGSIPALLEYYPALDRRRVQYFLGEKIKPYEDDELIVYKGKLIRHGRTINESQQERR